MPVTASTLVHRAPARAWTRGSPNRKAGAPPAILGEGGPRDPLKGWTRKDAALADTFSIEQCGVDRTRPGLQLVEMLQPAQAAQIARVVDHGLDAQRPSVLEILFDPGVPVEGVDVDLGAVGDDLRLVFPGRRASPPLAPPEDEL